MYLPNDDDARESAIFFLIGCGARVKDILDIFCTSSEQLSSWLKPMGIGLGHIVELSKRRSGHCLNCYVLSDSTFCCEKCRGQFCKNENILTTTRETGIIPTLLSKYIYFDVKNNRAIKHETKE